MCINTNRTKSNPSGNHLVFKYGVTSDHLVFVIVFPMSKNMNEIFLMLIKLYLQSDILQHLWGCFCDTFSGGRLLDLFAEDIGSSIANIKVR